MEAMRTAIRELSFDDQNMKPGRRGKERIYPEMHRIILDGVAYDSESSSGEGLSSEKVATWQQQVLASRDAGFT